MLRDWILVILVLAITVVGGLFAIPGNIAKKINLPVPEQFEKPFKLGLDLQGGTHLLYEADLSGIKKADWEESANGLRDVIERRVNLFGVQEPVVQTEQTSKGYRLIVELAGIDDPAEAIKEIGKTPFLEFREEMSDAEKKKILNMLPPEQIEETIKQVEKQTGKEVKKEDVVDYLPLYTPTELTGKYLKSAKVDFSENTFEPYISLEFNAEGAKLFRGLTKKNKGKTLAIYIDNQMISSPTVQEEISGGKAQITGQFTIEEAKELARNLSAGALPVPIKLISQQTVGPSLGKVSIEKSVNAGVIGFLLVILFMILFYRLSGIFASFSLLFYGVLILSLFKLIPVTLTLAGIAGFVLSLGMAVDANVLVFERLKEELKEKESFDLAINNAFSRAWTAVRDGNITTLITCLILFLVSSGFVQGFALVLGIGVLVSMFSAMIITKLYIKTFSNTKLGKLEKLWTR